MSDKYLIAIFLSIVFLALIAALWPKKFEHGKPKKNPAFALLGIALVLFSLSAFRSTIRSIDLGRSVSSSRGAVVVAKQTNYPKIFTLLVASKLISEAVFLLIGLACIRMYLNKKQ